MGNRMREPSKIRCLNAIAELRATGSIDDDTVIVATHISTNNVEAHAEIRDALTAKGITLAYDGQRLAF